MAEAMLRMRRRVMDVDAPICPAASDEPVCPSCGEVVMVEWDAVLKHWWCLVCAHTWRLEHVN